MSKNYEDIAVKTFSRLNKVTKGIYLWIIFVIVLFGYMPYVYKISIDYDNIIFASAGLLTFIAIFYALLISKEGREITDGIKDLIKDLENRFREKAKDEIDKTENIRKCLSKLESKNANINFVKRLTDIELFLLISVLSFTISIYLSLFQHDNTRILAFIFFMIGLGFSTGLVLEWSVIVKIIRDYKERLFFNR